MEDLLIDTELQYLFEEHESNVRFTETTVFYPSRNRCPECGGSQMVKPHRAKCKRCKKWVCKNFPNRFCYIFSEQLCKTCHTKVENIRLQNLPQYH